MEPQAEPARRLIVFARAPIPGACKTRLIPRYGARGAARLHRALAESTLRAAVGSGAEVELSGAPDCGHGQFQAWRREYGLRLRRQPEGDLGRRMSRSIAQALAKGAAAAVIVGTDCAALGSADIRAAFMALEGDADVVLQPASDGGYVLIGARRPLGDALRGIHWSSGHELAQTRARILARGWTLAELPERWDVDRPADVRRARREGLI